MRRLNLDRTFNEEEAKERCPLLVTRLARMATQLSGWGWGTIEIKYKYGKPGTGSAHGWITAERGDHGVTIEYLFRLNSRTVPTVKMVGGFWDGGPFRNETDLTQLAKPLRSAYNPTTGSSQGDSKMTETKPRPSKRVAKKAPAAENTPTPARKRAAKKVAAPEPEVEETPKKGRRRGRGAWENYNEQRAEVVALREAGEGWADIAEKVGLTAGMATFLFYSHEYGTDFHGQADADTIATERDENNLSWSAIEAKYWITRGEAWELYEEAGGDHFASDIGKGGRYVTRDPEVVEARRAEKAAARKASKPATTRRTRKAAFKGFDNETPEDDIINAVDGRTITWRKTRGDGEDSAKVAPDSADIGADRSGKRTLKFSDGRKSRTVYVNNITAIK